MVVDVQIGILHGMDVVRLHLLAGELGQRVEQLAVRSFEVFHGGREPGRPQDAVVCGVERDPHGLRLADLLRADEEGEAAIPACAAHTGAPRLAPKALIWAQRARQRRFQAGEHPDDAQLAGAEMQLLRVDGGGILHDIPQERGLGDAAVVDIAIIDLVFAGKTVVHGKDLLNRTG